MSPSSNLLQCQSQITHVWSCISQPQTLPLCSDPKIKSFVSFSLLSLLLLSPFLYIRSYSLPGLPSLSVTLSPPSSHSLTPDAKGKWIGYSKRLAHEARRMRVVFSKLACLFTASVRLLTMTFARDRSHMCWDLNGVWSGTLPPHAHTHTMLERLQSALKSVKDSKRNYIDFSVSWSYCILLNW